jgi:hypothetical protein
MKSSILSSFFFLQLVENFKKSNAKLARQSRVDVIDGSELNGIMKVFSPVYTIMETQAYGLPICEEDLDTSAALVSAFSWHYCLGITDPYIITQIMWEAYSNGDLSLYSKHYKKISNTTSIILSEMRAKCSKNA